MSDNNTFSQSDSRNKKNERLQNVLAKRGIASRRGAADIIKSGQVSVNGNVVLEPGLRVDPLTDEISLNGKILPENSEEKRTILLYKPRGLICSADNAQGETVCDLLQQQIPERLVPVGRLDKDSEGLLIMSNDGSLINVLTHPRYGHKKTYHVRVTGMIDDDKLRTLRSRMDIDGYFIKPVEVKVLKSTPKTNTYKLSFTLSEGRNRQIRKMCDQTGLKILTLKRVKIGPLSIGAMQPGDWRELHKNDIEVLMNKSTAPGKA
ncbi:MAG: pseudouridine synthase [Kiritimatiellia bacterium]